MYIAILETIQLFAKQKRILQKSGSGEILQTHFNPVSATHNATIND